nr:MAG TPA: hypothetical protein [Caudoviricetes sp.]
MKISENQYDQNNQNIFHYLILFLSCFLCYHLNHSNHCLRYKTMKRKD